MISLDGCQRELHTWGATDQVALDASKESKHVHSLSDLEGITLSCSASFDIELSMASAVSETLTAAGWKLRTLLRTRRHYTSASPIVSATWNIELRPSIMRLQRFLAA